MVNAGRVGEQCLTLVDRGIGAGTDRWGVPASTPSRRKFRWVMPARSCAWPGGVTQIGVPLEDVTTFGKFLGGSATNVSVAAARRPPLGDITRQNDPFGIRAQQAPIWRGDGLRGSPWLPAGRVLRDLSPTFRSTSTLPAGTRPADRVTDLPLAEIADAGVYWATLTRLSAEPSRQSHLAAWRVVTPALHDSRPRLPPDVLKKRRVGGDEERRSRPDPQHGGVGNREECRVAVGGRPRATAGPSGTRNQRRS